MTTPLRIGISALTLVCSQLAHAAIGEASYGGTGCPEGTVTSVVSNSRATVNLKLNEMETLTGDQTGAALSRKACALSIPVTMPAGKMIESIQATYEGNAVVADGATVKFQSEHFIAGTAGKVNRLTLEANEGSAFRITQNSKIESACGANVAIRMNFSLLNQSAASASLSAGIIDRVKYKLNFADCN